MFDRPPEYPALPDSGRRVMSGARFRPGLQSLSTSCRFGPPTVPVATLWAVRVQAFHEPDCAGRRRSRVRTKPARSYIAMLRALRAPVNSVKDLTSAGACASANRSSHPPRPRPATSGATISRPISHDEPSRRARTAPTSRPARRTHHVARFEPPSHVAEGLVERGDIESLVGDGLIDPAAALQHQHFGCIVGDRSPDDSALDGKNSRRPSRHHPTSSSITAGSPDVTPFAQ